MPFVSYTPGFLGVLFLLGFGIGISNTTFAFSPTCFSIYCCPCVLPPDNQEKPIKINEKFASNQQKPDQHSPSAANSTKAFVVSPLRLAKPKPTQQGSVQRLITYASPRVTGGLRFAKLPAGGATVKRLSLTRAMGQFWVLFVFLRSQVHLWKRVRGLKDVQPRQRFLRKEACLKDLNQEHSGIRQEPEGET